MAVLTLLTVTGAAVAADSRPALSGYSGLHPLWPQTGLFCYIGFSHMHSKGPTDLRVYRALPNGEYLFVGDPVALGYVGTKVGYFGPHPLPATGLSVPGTIYCYLRGPHFHATQPEPGPSFVMKNGVYWFMGQFSPEFEKDRYNVWMNDSPVLVDYQAPQVALADAPPGYRFPEAVRVPAPAGVRQPGSASASVAPPPPTGKGAAKIGPPTAVVGKKGPS